MAPGFDVPLSLQQPELLIDQLRERLDNPRTVWGDLEGLAASIEARGVIEPLVVRPMPESAGVPPLTYEILAGARRFRGAKLAGLTSVPVVVRICDDQTALEVTILENLQREDVSPLDEARAYEALQQADWGYTPEVIAAKVGKSTSYIYRRLKLLQLIPAARAKLDAGEIFVAHAERLARLTATQQRDALDTCTLDLFRGDEFGASEPAPISKLDAWIDTHVRIDPASPDVQHYFPEVADEVATAEATHSALLQLSESHHAGADLGAPLPKGVLGRGRWTPIRGTKDACPHVQRGVVVHGGPMRILEVCAQKGCPKHRPAAPAVPAHGAQTATATAATARHEAEQRRARLQRLDGTVTLHALRQATTQAVRGLTALPADLLVALVGELAAHHDDIVGFCAVAGLPEPEGPYDSPDLAGLETKKISDLIRFVAWLVLNTVAHANPKTAPALLKRYKVDLGKVETSVRAAGVPGLCRHCGCRKDDACPEGCTWVEVPGEPPSTCCRAEACRAAEAKAQKTAARGKRRATVVARPVAKRKARGR